MTANTDQGITGELYQAIIAIVDDRVREIKVTRQDFDDLTEAVKELAQAQTRTEARLDSLILKVEELAQAQIRTEARLDSLTLRVEELAQAQIRTEARLDSLTLKVEELAQAQTRTESRVEALAQAQLKTELIVQKLFVSHETLKQQVAGLSDSVGYVLEDRAIAHLPELLPKDHGITIHLMDRRFIEYPDGKDDEINIYGEGTLNGEPIHVIGESKAQLGRKDVDRYKKMLKRVQAHLGGRIVPILVTYAVKPQVERYAIQAIDGLLLYRSYQFKP